MVVVHLNTAEPRITALPLIIAVAVPGGEGGAAELVNDSGPMSHAPLRVAPK
jgi:hypothetical protein